MNVGYYFHVPAVFDAEGGALVPAHYGVFVEEVARQAGQVTFYAHGSEGDGTETMRLAPPLVRCVDLGPARPAPVMAARPGPNLTRLDPRRDGLDAMLVRGPSSLLPAIVERCRRAGVPAVLLLVADWRTWRPTAVYPWWRNRLIQLWHQGYLRLETRAARHARVLAISRALLAGRGFARAHVVRTSSFREADLVALDAAPRPAAAGVTRLVFTGRLVEEKGLYELVEAAALLGQAGHRVHLTLVGYTSGDRTIDRVVARAAELGIADRVTVPGFLPAGPNLWGAYLAADVYVLPTYGEGSVPRTVKEAFAASLPVVTTDVPAIAEHLVDGDQALLVPAGSAPALADAIARLLDDAELRAGIAARGRAWVADWTNEASARLVVDHIRGEIEQRAGVSPSR